MEYKAQLKFSALALAIIGLSLLEWIWDGKVLDYIHPQLIINLFPTALICIILAQVVLSTAGKDRKTISPPLPNSGEDLDKEPKQTGLGLLWLALPLVIGFLIP